MYWGRKAALFAFCVGLGCLGLWEPAQAQQVFGTIAGHVADPTGAAVSGAKVTISDPAKGVKFQVTTDTSGNYIKGQLIPDQYVVTIEASGFQTVVSNPIPVRVDEEARYDATLSVGSVSTQVEVTAAAPLLQADRADVQQVFTGKELSDLPNIGRNVQSDLLLNPGTAKLGWQHAEDENPQGSIQMVVNGMLFDSTGYELDGTTNQDPILGIIVINPTMDSLAEAKQANQDFSAEYEYIGGGLAAYSTKSGSNEFHGDAFEYLQLNTPGFTTFGRNPFNEPNGAPLYRQNQFGGSIGGRIIKDKLFFFADTQLNREFQGGGVLTTVPTAAERTGNLSDWLAASPTYQIFDPATGNPATGAGRQPFPGNIIPQSRLSPQALAILNYFPLPNTNAFGTSYQNNYTVSGGDTVTANQFDTRWDYYVNSANAIFGRYSYEGGTVVGPGAFGLEAGGPNFAHYAGNSSSLNQSLALGWTDTISPTMVNEFRYGFMRYHVFDVPNGYGTSPATTAGIPGLNLNQTTSGMPAFYINNPTASSQLGYALGVNQCNCPLIETEYQNQFVDNLNIVRGNHSFKVGADIRFANNLRVPSDSHRAGELTFNGGVTGLASAAGAQIDPGLGLATFLLGDVTNFNRYVSTSTNAQENQHRFFFYGQDEWHMTPKLTVTYGVRWDIVLPETVNAPGNGATLNLSNGLMYVFGIGGVPNYGIQNAMWHDFAPRVGVAYQLDKKTVVRAGYGWAYDLGTFGTSFGHNVTQNPPVLANQNVNPSNPFSSVFTLAQGPPAPTPIQVSSNGTYPLPNGISPKFRPAVVTLPQTYLYNASIQRQLTNKIAVTASYVGNSARHNFLGTSQTINPNEAIYVPGQTNTYLDQPYYAKYGWTQGLQYYCDCANDQYNSLQTQIKIDAWDGWTLNGSYTYQRQYGPGWGPYDPNYYFMYDRAAGYGYTDLLPRNQITLAQTYSLPIGKGKRFLANINKWEDYAIGGWQLSGITTYYSGFPFNPTLETYPGQPNAGPSNRPNLGSGNPFAGAQGNRNQWFVGGIGSAFLLPAPNTFGNYPIGTLFGPRFIQQDMSIFKTFPITERVNFVLRMDAQNAFNHTNLGLPNSDIQSPTVGQITGIAGGGVMRVVQFSGTINF
jgi:hypothetical protein